MRHQRVQRLRRLLRQRSVRRADGVFVVEGTRVLEVALAAGAPVEAAYYAPGATSEPQAAAILEAMLAAGVRCYPLAPGVLERVADTTTPQPICAVVRQVPATLAACAEADTLLVCADVRDPGNLGSALRSADGAGIDGLVCLGGTVDPYNPKTVRASAGAIFRVPVAVVEDVAAGLDALRGAGLRLVGTSSTARCDYAAADLSGRVALVVGNEANGLGPDELAAMDEVVRIPLREGAESLNVAMAATVLCFELARRRRPPA